ncbi:glycosyl hydrolase [Paenibacillus sp. J23TS9]|uniref:glycosyl hydrolase n=1 Tax=Paenibacillus sp. J23TS9 TaxID=2807193 RepID=UPI001BCFB0F3|nr:glycosyl hydrolase [Paenibacillus sp. J23TS9]
MTNKLYELFVEPTPAFRGKPFWSWNGKLDQEELLRQIQHFKEMGFGGFFMHSRTGLATEYLGDEWFKLINICSEEAERLGLEAWLYDEDRWPSGSAGGMVTQEPKYRLKFIRLEVIPVEQFVWKDHMFAAFQCDVEGMIFTNCTQMERDQDSGQHTGRTMLAFSLVEQEKESFYNGYTYLDTLNREAVDRFLEITHEQYKAKSGKHFGKSIKGIFTDEPHRGALMDGFGIQNENGHWHAPWTYSLFEQFQSVYGYDLISRLPELFLLPEGKELSQVKWHYVDLIQEMFHDSFAKPMKQWCESNGLILTGHTLHEDSLTAQTAMVGSLMRFYEHMGYPGVDVLTEGNVNYWIVKQLSSAARQLGKTWMLSELYGCTGWQMPFEGHKAVGDWQALFGINLRCHHLSWYTMEGESKRDYPASISHQSAWWHEYSYVETYFSRLGVIMTSGLPVCDLLVINPVESLWGQIYPGWSRGLSAVSRKVQELEQRYQDNFHYLAGGQIDFDYGDEEMLGRLYNIGKDRDGSAVLHVGQAAYRAVLVTGMMTMRRSTLQILKQFRDAGGTVIFAGDAPGHMDALASDEVIHFAKSVKHIPFDCNELLTTCREAVRTWVTIRDAATGASIPDIFAQVRKDKEQTYIVLMNMNRGEWHRNVVISVSKPGFIEEWNCQTGERGHITTNLHEGANEWITDFAPVGEHVYVIDETYDQSLPTVTRYVNVDSLNIAERFKYRLNEPNVLVLDRVTYRLGKEEKTNEPMEILKADRQIRTTLQLPFRHGEMIQPWFVEKSGQSKTNLKHPLVLSYHFHVHEIPDSPIYLALESPESFQISMNGEAIDGKDTGDWWVDRCFIKIPLPAGNLHEGENVLELQVMFHQGIHLEAIYLLGEFGVNIEGNICTMIKQPDTLKLGSITEQGFPFYGGIITYIPIIGDEEQYEQFSPKTGENHDSRTIISFPAFEAGCIKVRHGEDDRIIAWQPYETELIRKNGSFSQLQFDLILTRRNTFGPLHQLPLLTSSYGPGNWTTEGDSFTEGYVLLPTGLLSPPRLINQRAIDSL